MQFSIHSLSPWDAKFMETAPLNVLFLWKPPFPKTQTTVQVSFIFQVNLIFQYFSLVWNRKRRISSIWTSSIRIGLNLMANVHSSCQVKGELGPAGCTPHSFSLSSIWRTGFTYYLCENWSKVIFRSAKKIKKLSSLVPVIF